MEEKKIEVVKFVGYALLLLASIAGLSTIIKRERELK